MRTIVMRPQRSRVEGFPYSGLPRLVSEQFETDPSLASATPSAQAQAKADRLRELGKKLFG